MLAITCLVALLGLAAASSDVALDGKASRALLGGHNECYCSYSNYNCPADKLPYSCFSYDCVYGKEGVADVTVSNDCYWKKIILVSQYGIQVLENGKNNVLKKLQCGYKYTLYVKGNGYGSCGLKKFYYGREYEDEDCYWCKFYFTPSCKNPVYEKCREPYGDCDVADYFVDYCKCPNNVQPKNYVCRPAAGCCDKPEYCDGYNAKCPDNYFQGDNVVCASLNVDNGCPGCKKEVYCKDKYPDCPIPAPACPPAPYTYAA